MAKATILLLFILTLIAVLLFGINIGKKVEQWQKAATPTPTKKITPTITKLTPTNTATPSAIPAGKVVYKNTQCGYEIVYPKTWIKTDFDARSIALSENNASGSSRIAIVCAQEIPKPPITEDRIEQIEFASISATLYHDASPQDGTPLDEVITKIPGKNMEIFIAGFGKSFEDLLSSFRFLP